MGKQQKQKTTTQRGGRARRWTLSKPPSKPTTVAWVCRIAGRDHQARYPAAGNQSMAHKPGKCKIMSSERHAKKWKYLALAPSAPAAKPNSCHDQHSYQHLSHLPIFPSAILSPIRVIALQASNDRNLVHLSKLNTQPPPMEQHRVRLLRCKAKPNKIDSTTERKKARGEG